MITTPTEPAPLVRPTGDTPSPTPFTVGPMPFAQCRHSSHAGKPTPCVYLSFNYLLIMQRVCLDGDFYVYPNLTCTDDGLTFQLTYNYDANQIVNSRIQLFYQCTDVAGRVSNTAADKLTVEVTSCTGTVFTFEVLSHGGSF